MGKNCDAKSHLLPRLDVINKMHEMRRKTEPNSIFTKITLKVNLIRMQHNAFSWKSKTFVHSRHKSIKKYFELEVRPGGRDASGVHDPTPVGHLVLVGVLGVVVEVH